MTNGSRGMQTYSSPRRAKGNRSCKTRKAHPCAGCGRVLPKGSVVTRWTIWRDGYRHELKLCSDCQEVVYGCDRRPKLDYDPMEEGYMLRNMCERCDYYPTCDKVDYQRREEPGEIFFGDLPL